MKEEGRFRTYPFIEKPPSIFGLSLVDLFFVLIVFLALLVFGGLVVVIGWDLPVLFCIPFIWAVGAVSFLRISNKENQPNYLISLYSFLYLQSKKIYIAHGILPITHLEKEHSPGITAKR